MGIFEYTHLRYQIGRHAARGVSRLPDHNAFFTLPLCRNVVTVVISPVGWPEGGENSYKTLGSYVEPEF